MKRLLMTTIAVSASIMAQAAFDSPRSGEIFQTTREGPGELSLGCIYFGVLIPVVGWVTLLPAGIVIGVVDELVVSPAIDIVCLPYDLLQPHHGFTIRVRDTEGKPVHGAEFFANMSTDGLLGDVVREKTDENGEIQVSKLNRVALNHVTIKKDGYYYYREYDGPYYRIGDIKPDAEERLVLDFVMKRKVRPAEKIGSKLNIPESLRWQSAELLFDCEAGDWLPPYGKGKKADLKVNRAFECKDVANPRKGYHVTISISAVGHGNGFLEDGCNWYDGMPGAYEAPSGVEFSKEPVVAEYFWEWEGGGSTGSRDFDHSKYMIMRLRTRFSDDGKVIGAHYGKLLFPVGYGCTAIIRFVRDENETRIE